VSDRDPPIRDYFQKNRKAILTRSSSQQPGSHSWRPPDTSENCDRSVIHDIEGGLPRQIVRWLFPLRQVDTLFCSHACRQRAYRLSAAGFGW
jgi:hypothetical protein